MPSLKITTIYKGTTRREPHPRFKENGYHTVIKSRNRLIENDIVSQKPNAPNDN